MKMSSSTISDLQAFVQRRDLLLGVNGGVVRLQFYRYGLSDLTSPSRFWSFLMVAARRIILAIFIPAAMSSTMVIRTLGSPAASTRLFGLFSLEYWCWYSCRCWLIVLMVACVHVALALRLKYKNMGAPLLVFAGIWYDIYAIIFWLPSEKYEIVSWKKKSLKISKISSFSFRLYFVIVGVSSTMYYLLL
jgi:hypothetical protein